MLCRAFACDYDGTIATQGRVTSETLEALTRLKASGRKLVLVSGRRLEELEAIFPDFPIFDLLVLENGALLYEPILREEILLTQPPPTAFVNLLKRSEIEPLNIGRVIVATTREHEGVVCEALEREGLGLRIIWNKNSLMILPHRIDKGSGVLAAFVRLEMDPREAVAIGDAENDRELFLACGFRVAVANAVPELRHLAHLTTEGAEGQGVVEAIEGLLSSDSVVA